MSATQDNKLWSITVVCLTASMYIGTSAGLIAFNKTIMAKDKFPFSAGLGLLHASFCSIAAFLLFQFKPELFPSLTDPEKKIVLDRSLILKVVFPIAVCFSAQIVLSNQAYLFADVAFLQMIKESNVVNVYLLSVMCSIEVFGWRQLRLVCLIMFATWMSVKGELHFTVAGFVLQGLSCLAESVKITMQGLLLTSSGRGLDALSYMLLVMPVCAAMFGSVFMVCAYVDPHHQIIDIPTLADWINMRWLLLANACVALTLNFTGMLFIRNSSAVAYVLAGIIKDVMIVLSGVFFMGHETGVLQAAGFTLQVGLIFLWSLLKTFPKEFQSGFVNGFQVIFFGKKLEPSPMIAGTDKDYGAVVNGATKDVDGQLSETARETTKSLGEQCKGP